MPEVSGGQPPIPAGWYPDPTGLPCDRFWDGTDWAEQTRPQAAAALTPGAASRPGAPMSAAQAPLDQDDEEWSSSYRGYWRSFAAVWPLTFLVAVTGTAAVAAVRDQPLTGAGLVSGVLDAVVGCVIGATLANLVVAFGWTRMPYPHAAALTRALRLIVVALSAFLAVSIVAIGVQSAVTTNDKPVTAEQTAQASAYLSANYGCLALPTSNAVGRAVCPTGPNTVVIAQVMPPISTDPAGYNAAMTQLEAESAAQGLTVQTQVVDGWDPNYSLTIFTVTSPS